MEAETAHAELQKRQTILEEEYALALEAVQAAPFDTEPGAEEAGIPIHGMDTPKGHPDQGAEGAGGASREGLATPPFAAEPGAKRARNWKEQSLHLQESFASQLSTLQQEGGAACPFPDNDNMQVDGAGQAACSSPGDAAYGLLGPQQGSGFAAPQEEQYL